MIAKNVGSRSSFFAMSLTPANSLYKFCAQKMHIIYQNQVVARIENLIRPFFFPLFAQLPSNHAQQMEKERKYVRGFWDVDSALYPELSHHKMIKEHFVCRNKDVTFMIEGKKHTSTVCVIESKTLNPEKTFCNFVHVLGIFGTLDNNIMATYPFLSAYLDIKGEKPPIRFVLMNHYSTRCEDGSKYIPKNLSDAGYVLSETLKSLEEKYGTLNQLYTHSLGAMVTAAALKYFSTTPSKPSSLQGRIQPIGLQNKTAVKTTRAFQSLPKHIIFDRGPSSIEKLSQTYLGGSFLLPLAKMSGWDIHFGKAIAEFLRNFEKRSPDITVINALQDHRFSGAQALCFDPDIQSLRKEKKITTLVLDICQQSLHQNAQHSYGNFYGSHLLEEYKDQNFLSKDQSLAAAIVGQALS